MEQERLLHSSGVGGSGGSSNPMLRGPTIHTTFTLPFTRYTTRLMTADHHRILLGDCTDHRSEDDVDDRRIDDGNCAYSKPILVLDLVWNLAFVLVAAGVLLTTINEQPTTPLRLWLGGYAFECILHMGFVYLEYRRRNSDYHGAEVGISLPESRNRTRYGGVLF